MSSRLAEHHVIPGYRPEALRRRSLPCLKTDRKRKNVLTFATFLLLVWHPEFGIWSRQDEKLDVAQVRLLITALDEKCRTLAF